MSGPSDLIFQMEHITKEFPGVLALDDVNLAVRTGSIHAICGENGAGKSTLMKVLSGVHPHGSYAGRVIFEGKETNFHSTHDSELAGIAIIHQELALIPELSIAENIFLGDEPMKGPLIDWAAARKHASQLLALVELDLDPNLAVKKLGVGQQQLVEIAKALRKDTRLLILDEPTSALNEADSAHLLELMRGLQKRGITCIMISHKLNEIAAVCDSITIMRDGKTVDSYDVTPGSVDEDRIIRLMVGRPLDNRYPEHTPKIGEVIFEVRDWLVEHPDNPGRMVCNNSSFTVRSGEVVGLAGLMGAGRTELARSLFGRTYGQWLGGEMWVKGKPVQAASVREAIDAGLAYVPEDRKTLGLNLLDRVKRTIVCANEQALLRGILIDRDKEEKAAESYRVALKIKTPSIETGVSTLSGGNQQKAVLAKWLFSEPDVLILDEPTRGIDVGAKFEIYKLIHQMADEGKAVVVISSELPELLGISDRIYTICEGRVTGELPTAQADQESLMRLMTTGANREATPNSEDRNVK
ncbi:Xylose import ATP-binding protein XylG [Propionicimonas sp. T2.31MG-18]|uniref:ATP-binding cassette domain-containing protein n=1 Tax=Propionicimonas sp. T2.31MG-18 TaxID=3157620 RepID=UPI0035EC117F